MFDEDASIRNNNIKVQLKQIIDNYQMLSMHRDDGNVLVSKKWVLNKRLLHGNIDSIIIG